MAAGVLPVGNKVAVRQLPGAATQPPLPPLSRKLDEATVATATPLVASQSADDQEELANVRRRFPNPNASAAVLAKFLLLERQGCRAGDSVDFDTFNAFTKLLKFPHNQTKLIAAFKSMDKGDGTKDGLV